MGKLEAGSLQVGVPRDRGAFLTFAGRYWFGSGSKYEGCGQSLPRPGHSGLVAVEVRFGFLSWSLQGWGQSSVLTHDLASVHLCVQPLHKPSLFFFLTCKIWLIARFFLPF